MVQYSSGCGREPCDRHRGVGTLLSWLPSREADFKPCKLKCHLFICFFFFFSLLFLVGSDKLCVYR